MFVYLLITLFAVCEVRCQTVGELAAATEEIWAADTNRFPDGDCIINSAGPNLFAYVNEARLNQGTYALFTALLDNYNEEIGIPDTCDSVCQAERDAFLDAILQDPQGPMRIAHRFLVDHNRANPSVEGFKAELEQYWFQFYSRSSGSELDSSGFEHVFLGELRAGRGDVTGFHGWISAYLEEQKGTWDYNTFTKECDSDIFEHSFYWYGALKPITSIWLRVSPEAELALMTVCFQVRNNQNCHFTLDGNDVSMKTFPYNNAAERAVGTAYPTCEFRL